VTMTTRRQRMVAAILLAGLLDLTANYLAAHVLLPVGPFLIPGGTVVFALGFTTYDYIRRQHGARATLAAIGLGCATSALYALAFGGGVGRRWAGPARPVGRRNRSP